MTFDASFAKDIRAFMEIAPDCVDPTMLYAGDMTTAVRGIRFGKFRNTCSLFPPARMKTFLQKKKGSCGIFRKRMLYSPTKVFSAVGN